MRETRHIITITKSGHYCHTKTTPVCMYYYFYSSQAQVSNHSLIAPQERSIGTEEEKDDEQIGEDNDRIVPLLKIGADGNIVIDETRYVFDKYNVHVHVHCKLCYHSNHRVVTIATIGLLQSTCILVL